MTGHPYLRWLGVLSIAALAAACTTGETVPPTGSGGDNGGGSAGTNGSSAGTSGGSAGTVGTSHGGTTGAAGTVATSHGGTTGAAGTVATSHGGTTGTGGTVATSHGGTTGTAGTSGGTAGTLGTGGTTATACPATFQVATDGYVQAPAYGGACWHGYAFAGGDSMSSILPKDFSACGSPCALTMTGMLAAATAANSYAGVAYIGFNIGQLTSSTTMGTVVPGGTNLVVKFANTSTPSTLPLRVQVGNGTTTWCYTITGASPATVPYAMMNTACWDNSGTYYGKQAISQVQLVVPGVATGPGMVNTTITGISEN
jgi:hypothetical protein